MLTISQLAAYAGVTVRAIRHYHQRGLLAEPDRDSSGYRRYDGHHVIELIRIRTLTNAGVPLARVAELLSAGPQEFAAAIRAVDQDLERRIAELTRHRADLAQLPSAERLSVPDEVSELLDQLRAIGISERTLTMEREGWILLSAAYPDLTRNALEWKRRSLADPAYRRLALRYEEAFDWDPDDPRLVALAEEAVASMELIYPVEEATVDHTSWTTDAATYRLISNHNLDASPAWLRLNGLVEDLARQRGYPMP